MARQKINRELDEIEYEVGQRSGPWRSMSWFASGKGQKMEKKQFIAAGILVLASVGLVFAIESTPKAETASHSEDAAARILELEHKIDVQEKLIATLKKQLKDKKEENRKLKILCKRYNIPQSAYRELMDPRKQRADGASGGIQP